MSVLNDDKKVLERNKKGQIKREALKDVDAPLRDQIPEKLAKKLEEMKIGEKVVKIWNAGNANRAEWLERQEEYLQDWDEFLISTSEGPFQGSSSLHIPMPLIVAKAMHARFLQALLGIEPYFSLKARTEASIPRAALVSDTMSYCLKDWINYGRGIEGALDTWVWEWVTTGCGILKARWECQYEKFVDVRSVPKAGPPRTTVMPDGTERLQPTIKFEDEEVEVTNKTFEGPLMEWVDNEDFLIVGGQGDPQMADFLGHRQKPTASELWTLADRKIFREEVVKEIVDGGPDTISGSTPSNMAQVRAENAGKASLDTESDLDRYEIIEAYLKVDVTGTGINSNVIVWVHKRSGKICRATYLRRVNKAGEVPFFKIDFLKRPGQDYGIGLIEMIHPLSVEMDAIHNMRIDFGIMATMPFGFYRPTSSIDPETLPIQPGSLIPLDNPQTDVYFPNLGNRHAFGFQEEQAIQTYIERLTGMNDLSLGVLTGAQGATRTATGARALLGESNTNLDVYLRRLHRGWKQALQYLLHMLQQRIPEGLSFRVTAESGSDYWAQVKKQSDIAGDFDFELSANTANSNRSIQQELTAEVLMMASNPLAIQLGIVTPANFYEAMKSRMKALGVKDYGKFIQAPPNYRYIPSPEAEVDSLLKGIDVPVLPESDHQGYLAYFEEIMKSDELLGQFNEEQSVRLAVQAQKHEQMLQALEQLAAQQANAQQMAMNSQNSQQQANPGMNPMAGGGNSPNGNPGEAA